MVRACGSTYTGALETSLLWLVFFFQAEDGIRDYKVTGVQTCALPIWFFESIDDQSVANALWDTAGTWLKQRGFDTMRGPMSPSVNDECGLLIANNGTPRSEERRVGKECRSRWSPYH